MNRKISNAGNKGGGKTANAKGKKIKALNREEDFNTGSHSPSSLRNVNATYDDTGMGNNATVSKRDQKNAKRAKSNNKRNS